MVDATSLEAAVEAHGHVLVMFTTPWCGKCRQTGSNFKWAAEQLEGVEGVGGKTVLLAFLDLDKEDNESAALLKLRFGVTTLPALLWLQQGHDAKPFDGAATANGILEWVRAKFAKPALVPGTAGCDACRTAMEAFHLEWGSLVASLVASGAIVPGKPPGLDGWNGAADGAVAAVCRGRTSMRGMSPEIVDGCLAVLQWHGKEIVRRHLSLFSSWCLRSGDRNRGMTGNELTMCARQWSAKVKDGRLGLHEKSMPVCGAGYAGVCEWRPTNWTAAKNAGLSTTAGTSKCDACRGVAEDAAYLLRRSRLGKLRSEKLSARPLDLSEVLEGLCAGTVNRHEGDATEGPARVFYQECGEMWDGDDREDEVVQLVRTWAGENGAINADPGELADALCHPSPCDKKTKRAKKRKRRASK